MRDCGSGLSQGPVGPSAARCTPVKWVPTKDIQWRKIYQNEKLCATTGLAAQVLVARHIFGWHVGIEKLEKFLNSKQKSEEKPTDVESEFNEEPEKKTLIQTEPEIQNPVVEETPIINEEEIDNKWENNEFLEGLTPMNEESSIIDLVQPNEVQIIEEPSPTTTPTPEPTTTPTPTPTPEPSSTPEPTTTPTPTPSSESIIIPTPEPTPSSTPEPTVTPVTEEPQNIETSSNDDEEKKNY